MADIDQLKARVAAAQDRIGELGEARRAHDDKLLTLIGELEQGLARKEAEVEEQSAAFQTAQAEKTDLETRIGQLEAENGELRSLLGQLLEAIDENAGDRLADALSTLSQKVSLVGTATDVPDESEEADAVADPAMEEPATPTDLEGIDLPPLEQAEAPCSPEVAAVIEAADAAGTAEPLPEAQPAEFGEPEAAELEALEIEDSEIAETEIETLALEDAGVEAPAEEPIAAADPSAIEDLEIDAVETVPAESVAAETVADESIAAGTAADESDSLEIDAVATAEIAIDEIAIDSSENAPEAEAALDETLIDDTSIEGNPSDALEVEATATEEQSLEALMQEDAPVTVEPAAHDVSAVETEEIVLEDIAQEETTGEETTEEQPVAAETVSDEVALTEIAAQVMAEANAEPTAPVEGEPKLSLEQINALLQEEEVAEDTEAAGKPSTVRRIIERVSALAEEMTDDDPEALVKAAQTLEQNAPEGTGDAGATAPRDTTAPLTEEIVEELLEEATQNSATG